MGGVSGLVFGVEVMMMMMMMMMMMTKWSWVGMRKGMTILQEHSDVHSARERHAERSRRL